MWLMLAADPQEPSPKKCMRREQEDATQLILSLIKAAKPRRLRMIVHSMKGE
jgi:hypothetical protein